MKRFVAVLLLLVIVFSSLPAAYALEYNYDCLKGLYPLRNGSSGKNVRRLQEALIDWEYLPKGSADGAYGDKTEAAVKAFQRKNGFAGEIGYAGVATMFTQAVLYGWDIYGASAPYSRSNRVSGEYGVRNCQLSYSTSLDASFTLVNKDESKTIEAVCVYWWMADSNKRHVDINGSDYWMSWHYGFNLKPGETRKLSCSLNPSSKEINKASSLRFIVGEIAYSTGEVYITYNASKKPYYSGNYILGSW